MHYVPDGSRRYIKELLHSNPDSFSGSKDLDSIKIIKKYFIGAHEVLLFEIQDKSGAKAIWFEDFLCKEEACFKSYYLNIFGKGVGAKIFNQFLNIEKIKSSQPETNYKKIVLDKEYFGANNPFELYLNAKDITTDEMSEQWYLKLDKIREFEEGPDKMSLIAGYVPTIFDGWEVNKVVNFGFNTVRIDKDLLISNLYGVNDFSVYGFLDTDQIIWVYATARTYDDKFASFLFAYDKRKEKFLMKGSEIGVGRILMNRAVESKLFELNTDDVTYDEYKYKARKKDGVINAFYNDLRPSIQWDWIYTMFASVLLLALVFFMALYIKRPRQKNSWVVFGTGNAPSA